MRLNTGSTVIFPSFSVSFSYNRGKSHFALSRVLINKFPSQNVYLFQVFTKARAAAPAILFLDEVDAVVRKRSTDGCSGVEARILSTLLNEIDGVGISSNVYETTNRLVLYSGYGTSCLVINTRPLMTRADELSSLVTERFSKHDATSTIEIINNTRGGIDAKIWERANGGKLDHRCAPRNRSVSLETTKY